MSNIPHQLRGLTFCKVLPKSKKAFEDSWQMHQLNYNDIAPWVAAGNNYGIVCSRSNLVCVIDADHPEYVLAVENLLPPTFSVKTSSDQKRHFYYRIKDFIKDKDKIILVDPSDPTNRGAQGGDIRMGMFYTLGPGSIHPNTGLPYVVNDDLEIAEISFQQLLEVFSPYFRTSIISPKVNRSSTRYKLSISDVCTSYGINIKARFPDSVECFCAHPIHGSEGGTNFGVNTSKNVWCCRRHNVGGSAFDLVAIMEKFVDCADIKDSLTCDAREKTLAVIKERFGVEFTVNWDVTNEGKLRATYNNAANFIEAKEPDIKHNEFSDEIEYCGRKYSDADAIAIKELMRPFKLECPVHIIDESVTTYASRNSYHPVRDYLNSLHWDGVCRACTWLSDYAGAEKCSYTYFVSRTILVAAVARAFNPGCQYDYMPILEGAQGIGKTQLVRCLGGAWYKSISLTDHDKDTIQLMQGAWFIEVAELAAFAKRDIESLKAFLTIQADSARFAYMRHDKKYPRQSTFIGTKNPEENGYLVDKENRRFLPIAIKKVDLEGIKSVRDQLFAEAVALYNGGIKIYIDTAPLEQEANNAQTERVERDDWADIIRNWIVANRADISLKVTAQDIYSRVFGGLSKDYDMRVARRIGKAFRLLGCPQAKPETICGVTGRYHDITKILEIAEKDAPSMENNDYKVSNEKDTKFRLGSDDPRTFAPDGWE